MYPEFNMYKDQQIKPNIVTMKKKVHDKNIKPLFTIIKKMLFPYPN